MTDEEITQARILLNADVKITGGNPGPCPTVTPEPTAPAPAPAQIVPEASAPATTTIAAAKKAGKAAISTPGSVYRLDLGSKAGKAFRSSQKKVATVDKYGLVTIKRRAGPGSPSRRARRSAPSP